VVRSRQLSTRQARALRKSGGSCYGHVARCFDDDFARDEDCAKLLDGASLLVGMCALIGKSPACVRCLTGRRLFVCPGILMRRRRPS